MNIPEDCDTVCAYRFHCAWSAANEDMETPIVMCPDVRDQKGILIAPFPDAGIWRKIFIEKFGRK